MNDEPGLPGWTETLPAAVATSRSPPIAGIYRLFRGATVYRLAGALIRASGSAKQQ